MSYRRIAGAAAVCALAGLAGMLLDSPRARAQSPTELLQIQQGMAIAPVKLNTAGKDPALVGYGSYLVNAVGDCNGCHSAGPATEFAAGGNPYQGQHPTKINPATYLGGNRDFGQFPSTADPKFPHIISRNLTPDASGMSAGNTYDQFVKIMRTGVDPDLVHPTCTGAPDGKCIPAPFDGRLLQVMRWPFFTNMTDHELQAIYAYLSSIPCLEGGPNELANRCGSTAAKTTAVAGPKNSTVTARQLQLDGTKSTSADGKALTFQWTMAPGSPSAAMSGGTTATPLVQFSITRGPYTFLLTVTDSTGKSATDTVTVDFEGN